jgi:tetratricopeptide (TPR) repeat protein
MKRFFLKAAGLVLLLTVAATAPATQTARTFMDGTEAYRNGDWPAAIAAFESLADAGTDNGKLFYNLGNAYLKNDDLGRALLWYERALKRIPDDPDLRFNYDYALTLTKDERGERESPLLRILFFWKYQLSHSTVRWVAIFLNAALWIALSVLVIRKKRLLRPSIIMIAAATVIFSATAAFNYVEATRIRHAVVLSEQVAVRSGFTDTATQLFVLHAGTRVRVERESDTHLLIRYTEDKIGWVKKSEAGVI